MESKSSLKELTQTMGALFFGDGVHLGIKGCKGSFDLLIQLLFIKRIVAALNTRLGDCIFIEELVVLRVSGPG